MTTIAKVPEQKKSVYRHTKSAKRLQARVWLKKIRTELAAIAGTGEDPSNYKLDILFGQSDWERPEIGKEPNSKSSGESRIRTFTRIANSNILPRRKPGLPKRDADYDFPSRVNVTCPGTLALFDSPFWKLLGADPLNRNRNKEILEQSMSILKLTELNGAQAIEVCYPSGNEMIEILDGKETFTVDREIANVWRSSNPKAISGAIEGVLERSYEKLRLLGSPFDVLAFFGAVYRRSFHQFDESQLPINRRHFELSLSNLLIKESWLGEELARELLNISINRIVHGLRDYDVDEHGQQAGITKFMLNKFTYFKQEQQLEAIPIW